MLCICGSELEYKRITETRIDNDTTYVMRNVPAWVCLKCGWKEFDLEDYTVSTLCYVIENKIIDSDYDEIRLRMKAESEKMWDDVAQKIVDIINGQ